jgi:CspA family cold shock protein
MTGKVKWFDLQRGIGFIVPDEGGREAFIHYRDIVAEGFKALYEDDIVSFEIEQTAKGPKARNLQILRSAVQ